MDGEKQINLCYRCEFQKLESRAFYEDGNRTPSHIHIQRDVKLIQHEIVIKERVVRILNKLYLR